VGLSNVVLGDDSTAGGLPVTREVEEARIASRRFGFVMELQAGMQTVYSNWRRVVDASADIEATWVPVTYHESRGWIERMMFLPPSLRAAARSYLQVGRGLGSGSYDAVLFNTYNPAVVNQRALRRQPGYLMFDVTPRQYDGMAEWYEHEPDRSGWLRDWKDRRVRAAFQSAAGLFAWSKWAADGAIEDYGVPPDRVHILPPGVDTSLWTPPGPDQKEENERSGIIRLLFIGYAFERKGGDLLLRWARETRLRNWELHIVTMMHHKAPPGVIIHTGIGVNSTYLIGLARRCDLFVLPTRADCFSLATLEAMAVGLPVVTSRVGGIPDIVRDGTTGYLIEPGDYDDLKDRLEFLISSPDLLRAYGNAGRETVCAHFDGPSGIRHGLDIMSGRRA
jgi:glycosyltransferase involved in cell wall biosynthesis